MPVIAFSVSMFGNRKAAQLNCPETYKCINQTLQLSSPELISNPYSHAELRSNLILSNHPVINVGFSKYQSNVFFTGFSFIFTTHTFLHFSNSWSCSVQFTERLNNPLAGTFT